jgi:hypothetical protein
MEASGGSSQAIEELGIENIYLGSLADLSPLHPIIIKE